MIKILTIGLSCVMLTMAITFIGLSHNTIHTDEDSPYGMVKAGHIVHTDEDSPYGMIKVGHGLHTNQDSPFGMIKVNHIIHIDESSYHA